VVLERRHWKVFVAGDKQDHLVVSFGADALTLVWMGPLLAPRSSPFPRQGSAVTLSVFRLERVGVLVGDGAQLPVGHGRRPGRGWLDQRLDVFSSPSRVMSFLGLFLDEGLVLSPCLQPRSSLPPSHRFPPPLINSSAFRRVATLEELHNRVSNDVEVLVGDLLVARQQGRDWVLDKTPVPSQGATPHSTARGCQEATEGLDACQNGLHGTVPAPCRPPSLRMVSSKRSADGAEVD